MKFDMGSGTLQTLGKHTRASSDELKTLVKRLPDAVTPLEGRFNGAGRAAFNRFKSRADLIAAELNSSLGAILHGQSGMETAFVEGDVEMSDTATSAEGTANFDTARFGSGTAV